MLMLPASVKVYLAVGATDMRKGHLGLAALVRSRGQDLFTGDLFVFVSRRANRIKVLTWHRGGFVVLYKRLERGRFKLPTVSAITETVELDGTQLAMLLDGIDYSHVRRQKVWEPPKKVA